MSTGNRDHQGEQQPDTISETGPSVTQWKDLVWSAVYFTNKEQTGLFMTHMA